MEPPAAAAAAGYLLLLHRSPHVSCATSGLVAVSCPDASAVRRQMLQIISFRVDEWNTQVLKNRWKVSD